MGTLEEISKRIHDKRIQTGLTQEGFAKLIGASGQSVYLWESGKRYPHLSYVLRMSYVFGCEVSEITGGFKREEE